MSVSKDRYFGQKTFEAGMLANALRSSIGTYAKDPESLVFHIIERLEDHTQLSRDVRLIELETLCDLQRYNIDAYFPGKDEGFYSISLGSHTGVIRIYVACERPGQLQDVFLRLVESLNLTEMPSPLETAVTDLDENKLKAAFSEIAGRLKTLEDSVFAVSRTLRCFLSYKFAAQTEATAMRVQQFLTLLDVEVLTGASYEPRRVSEKVLGKLREPLDFIVVLVNRDGETMWTRDEIAAALHRGIAVVPLVERDAKFSPGLFGDLEYIPFDSDHVGDAFLKLLEAVRFIRRQRVDEPTLTGDESK